MLIPEQDPARNELADMIRRAERAGVPVRQVLQDS
jgi:hypothetical protein